MPAADGAGADLDAFHRRYHGSRVWERTYWLGVQTFKCPLDLWVYQELLHRLRPDLVIETGTAAGGSALFLATVLDALGAGRVLTIDVTPWPDRPVHPRISYFAGSSIAPDTVQAIRDAARASARVLVILDSLHACAHVLAELRAYAPLVEPGGYVVVEDTNLNGHPVYSDYAPDQGPGPMEAVDAFLQESPEFEIDASCEKFGLTFNPRGYLRRRAA